MQRRKILKWSVPILSSITLPTHAQTSCSMSDVSGTYVTVFSGDQVIVDYFTLLPDGSITSTQSADTNGSWSLNGNTFNATFDDRVFSGTVNAECNRITGRESVIDETFEAFINPNTI